MSTEARFPAPNAALCQTPSSGQSDKMTNGQTSKKSNSVHF